METEEIVGLIDDFTRAGNTMEAVRKKLLYQLRVGCRRGKLPTIEWKPEDALRSIEKRVNHIHNLLFINVRKQNINDPDPNRSFYKKNIVDYLL